ncbi:MAG: pyrroline-5-carboxylate reductase [Sphingomonas bacterium]|uniref:pyrroline-5-carboxylate reductase n=1 Tax=Sphingomonas bacterium TaxID=1895847 RepID=UPI0026163466|nr:pyrroline-5-carboxylate reductase [Sphingomonas bacterium]MDB5696811.1 pyrroline-5-carboxylate reductase [Sphingomonas bacterium]
MIGAGNMGGAMLRRWLDAGLLSAQVTVVSPSGRAMPDGVRVVAATPVERFDTIVLACKPQQLTSVAGALRGHAPRLTISILAGVELASLATLIEAPVVRAMPNLPVEIGKGVVALHGERGAEAGERAATLMAPLGLVEWIDDERLFDVVTALAGSGPAFLYRFIDALAQGGAALGLPADQAARLALATVEGSALLAARAEAGPGVLADRVASPGGSTREGLNVLDGDEALPRLIEATLRAAARRNAEMAAIVRSSG